MLSILFTSFSLIKKKLISIYLLLIIEAFLEALRISIISLILKINKKINLIKIKIITVILYRTSTIKNYNKVYQLDNENLLK